MEDGRIPKDLMYGERSTGKRKKGRPHLRFIGACKRDMKACGIDTNNWEVHAADRSAWKTLVWKGLTFGENKLKDLAEVKRMKRKVRQQVPHGELDYAPVFTCEVCSRQCKSRIGLYSHNLNKAQLHSRWLKDANKTLLDQVRRHWLRLIWLTDEKTETKKKITLMAYY